MACDWILLHLVLLKHSQCERVETDSCHISVPVCVFGGGEGGGYVEGKFMLVSGKKNCFSTKSIFLFLYPESLGDNWVVSGRLCLSVKREGSANTETRQTRRCKSSVTPTVCRSSDFWTV